MKSIILLLLLVVSADLFADLSKAKVSFHAPTSGGFDVNGKAEGIVGEIKGNVGEASFELKKLDTGLSLRNRHMLEDLHAETHPVATLKWNGPVADLTLNGVTKQIPLIHEGNKYSFEVKLPDFGLKGRRYPTDGGFGVHDDVSVTVELQ